MTSVFTKVQIKDALEELHQSSLNTEGKDDTLIVLRTKRAAMGSFLSPDLANMEHGNVKETDLEVSSFKAAVLVQIYWRYIHHMNSWI